MKRVSIIDLILFIVVFGVLGAMIAIGALQ